MIGDIAKLGIMGPLGQNRAEVLKILNQLDELGLDKHRGLVDVLLGFLQDLHFVTHATILPKNGNIVKPR